MSRSSLSHPSTQPRKPLVWQNDMTEDDISISPISMSHLNADRLLSSSLESSRWPRRKMAIEKSPDVSSVEGDLADCKPAAFASTVDLKEAPPYTDISLHGIIPSRSGEVPKVAIKRGLRGNWTKLLPHVVAILVTAAVCQLSFRNVYWLDLKGPNQRIVLNLTQGGILNFLQLAAKLHELLILASISSIVLHVVQAHLTSQLGLPLGMIANAFELGSARFLFRKSFWSLLWSGNKLHYLPFWAFSIFSTLLVTLSGPSSAIAVIPTLNYFDLPHQFNESVLPYYVLNGSTELWPVHLSQASLNAPDSGIPCNNSQSFRQQEICPVGGFDDIYNWAGNLLFGNSDQGTNISFPDTAGDTHRGLTARSCNREGYDGRASAVTINSFLSNALTTYWGFVQQNFYGIALDSAQPRIDIDKDTMIFAPRVESFCKSYSNYDFNPKRANEQPDMHFPVYGSPNSTLYPVPDWTYKYARPLNASNFTFVEMDRNDPESPSLGVVLTLPLIEQINGTWTQTTENLACSIYSQWIPVDVWYEPTMSDQVSYAITSSLSDTCLTAPTESTGREPINTTISIEYANAINQDIAFVTGDIPTFIGIFERFIFEESFHISNGTIFKAPIPGVATSDSNTHVSDADARTQRAKLVSVVIAGVVTDGIARIAGAGNFPFSAPMFLLPNRTEDGELMGRFPVTSATGGQDESLNTTDTADIDNWLRINPTFKRYGYGYRWEGSRTAQFGISILLVHAVVAIIHMVMVFTDISGHGGGIQRAWESIPELFALAVNSRPSEQLRNTCAGIGEEKTYNELVGVRETSDGHLEAILGPEHMRRHALPRAGVKYGTFPE